MLEDNVSIKMMNLLRSFEIIDNSLNFIAEILNKI